MVNCTSLHVSSTPVLNIGRINCNNMTSGMCQLCRWPWSVHTWPTYRDICQMY